MTTMISSEQIERAVNDAIRQLLERAGHPPEFTADEDVIGALGLCSEDGIELACVLETALGIKIPEAENPLIDDSGKAPRGRTVQQIYRAVAEWAVPTGGQ